MSGRATRSFRPMRCGAIRREATSRRSCKGTREDNRRRNLYFPQARWRSCPAHRRVLPARPAAPKAWTARRLAGAHSSPVARTSTTGGGRAGVLPGDREVALFPGATDALVYNHDVFDKDYTGDRTEDQDNKNPGVNARYGPRAQRPERQQRPRALPRAAHEETAQFRARAKLHGGRGRREDVAPLHVDQPRQADGDGRAVPLRAVRVAVSPTSPISTTTASTTRQGRRDHTLHLTPDLRVVLVPRSSRPRCRC